MEHTIESLYNMIKEQVEMGNVRWDQITAFRIYRTFLQDGSGVERIQDLELATQVFHKIQEQHIYY